MTATHAAPTPSTTTYEYCNLTHPNAVTFTSNATAPDAALCVTATHDAELANVNVDAGAYEYDAAGRMTSRPSPTGSGTQTLRWDVLSNLTTITPIAADGTTGVATTYLYDAAGQRFAALTGTTATIYMGSWEATDSNTGANPATGADDISVTRFYSAGGVQLASKTTGGQLLITLGDVQGSAQVTVDPTGVTTSNAYTPYGVKRDGSTVVSAHGWLNQIADTTGLTYLNARYYDPVLGRFISPDPLMNPADPRTLDPYRYADNNPIVYSDATGLNPACGVWTKGDPCWTRYIESHENNGAMIANHATQVAPVAKYLSYDDFRKGIHYVPIVGVSLCQVCGTTPGWVHGALDAGGLAPLIGEFADAINAALYARDGDTTNAAIAAGASIPFFGWFATGGKYTAKGSALLQTLRKTDAPAQATNTGTRLAQDIAVNPVAPPALGLGRSIGRASHNQALQADIAALPRGATAIRVNQQQVNALGQRVGINRPDLQYTLNGQRYYVEYEGLANSRGALHEARILANDPGANFVLRIVP